MPDDDLARECIPTGLMLPAATLPPSVDESASNGKGRRKHNTRKPAADPIPSANPETVRYDIAILERPSDDRPRGRLEKMGASALSVTELLAIQLRTGSLEQSALGLAGELLYAFGDQRGVAAATREELCRVKGIGPVKAVEICAAASPSLARTLALHPFAGSD